MERFVLWTAGSAPSPPLPGCDVSVLGNNAHKYPPGQCEMGVLPLIRLRTHRLTRQPNITEIMVLRPLIWRPISRASIEWLEK